MKTEIVDVSATRKEIKIEIPAADVRAEFERVSGEYARRANVPGFRKGKTPVSVVRARFKNEIRGEVLQKLVPEAVNRAIAESGLQVLGQPDVHLDTEHLEKLGDAPVSLHAHVDVLPEVELGEYAGLEATRRTRPVTEEMVERQIEALRENHATLQPVEDRGAETGDTVVFNYRGRVVEPEGEPDFDGQDAEVTLGREGVHEAFNENLSGVRADDAKTFRVKYPEDFMTKELAGKEAEYEVTVTAVRRKEVPALDDEWAKSLGEEIEGVEHLRRRVRENLEARARYEAESRVRDEVVGRLVDAHRFELPDSLVDYQANQLLQTAVRDMVRHGIDPRGQEFDWEQMRERARTRAEEELRASMLLEALADRENIEVTDEEVEEEIAGIAEASRQPVEQVRAALTKEGGASSIADRLRNRKALDLLVQKANVRDEEWQEETRGDERGTMSEPAAPEASGE